ncbi:MAG: response regulator [Methanosarcinales archaeon]|nr:response regulator [Methanosarcinales archaeon]
MPRRIMIVDDAKYMREMLEEIVETSEGYEIVGVAADGEEAIAKYLELMDAGLRPDIVTMDIVMPNADGIAVIRELKRYDPDARILAISALGSPDTIDRAMDAGAQDYITKPFSVNDLLDTIQRVSASREKTQGKAVSVLAKENVIPGTIASNEGGHAVITIQNAAIEAISDYSVDERVELRINPEDIELRTEPGFTENQLEGTIVEINQSNPVSQVKLDCGFELSANIPTKTLDHKHFAVGDRAYATFSILSVRVNR